MDISKAFFPNPQNLKLSDRARNVIIKKLSDVEYLGRS